ncbi:hypothetical protein EJ02DRAFT_468268 [Clathrospora elynae]|uniref:BED-type domain-containing protein n=1 Tax=Clathrospora elynae TaxID=706981 RepID=A0A6A5SIM3_9PLEO|nr:hypothetical protein EJ02DRAFT_468268 [Clathrospora elynae]
MSYVSRLMHFRTYASCLNASRLATHASEAIFNLPLLSCATLYAIPHGFDITTQFCGDYLLQHQLVNKYSCQRQSWIYKHRALVYHPSNPGKDRWICTHCNSAGYEATFDPVASTAASGHLLQKHGISKVEQTNSLDTPNPFDLDSHIEDNRFTALNAQIKTMDERLHTFTKIDLLGFQQRLVDWVVLNNQSYDGASSLQVR